MQLMLSIMMVLAVLSPSRGWFAPDQPLTIRVQSDEAVSLLLYTFMGDPVQIERERRFEGEQTIDLKEMFPDLSRPGTYLLYAVTAEADVSEFVGTPLVIGVRADRRPEAPPDPMVTRIEPLRYAVMKTEYGEVTMAFYYDVAPHTVSNFQFLAAGGYYDGLAFHRIVPGFVIQGGDPRGNGTGGPGYRINAEFSDRPHAEGVLSMARTGDPNEPQMMPRPQFADSAGSQFFICLDYEQTRQLDGRYTVFGRVVDGMNAVREISRVPLAEPRTGRPEEPQIIQSIEIFNVTAEDNPYPALQAERR